MEQAFACFFDQWYKEKARNNKQISNLGFFSRPFRIYPDGMDIHVMKIYKPIRDHALAMEISANHTSYIEKLNLAGLKLPETKLWIAERNRRYYLVIVQPSFLDEELVRNRMINGDKAICFSLLEALLKQTVDFLLSGVQVGFHPTLRNFAWRDGLWFFDTFPPMDMPQPALNRIILRFTPVSLPLSLIPLGWINRVSDEYYQPALMLKGLVGSTCRLRPEWADDFLLHARTVLSSSALPKDILSQTLGMLNQPPRLSALWTGVRSLLGKEGKPNLKR